ncbi:MAG: InlB B-repeat-containing protein [Kiritimatiellae bacterium]|nr:InlB B-repeat-containing protein [Kiritimatiellia bacterium]
MRSAGRVPWCRPGSPKGGAYSHLPDAERDGYPFLGWFSAAEGGSRVLEGTPVTEEDARTLYAHWGQTVRFDPNGGTCARTSVKCFVGDAYAHFAIPVREGYKFKGWYDAKEGGSRVRVGMTVTADAERTLYAHWQATAAALSITGFSRSSRPASAARSARPSATECTLQVDAPAGIPFEIQWTPVLGGEWTVLHRWIPAADGESSVPVVLPADSPAGFFRVVGADAE